MSTTVNYAVGFRVRPIIFIIDRSSNCKLFAQKRETKTVNLCKFNRITSSSLITETDRVTYLLYASLAYRHTVAQCATRQALMRWYA